MILISKKPESCWLAMSAAYKEAGTTGSCGEQVPGVMRLSQVVMSARGQAPRGSSADSPPAPAGSPHLKDTAEQRERCSAAPPPPGPGLASYLLGADLPAALGGGGRAAFISGLSSPATPAAGRPPARLQSGMEPRKTPPELGSAFSWEGGFLGRPP